MSQQIGTKYTLGLAEEVAPDPMADAAYWASMLAAFAWFLPAMLVIAPFKIVPRVWRELRHEPAT